MIRLLFTSRAGRRKGRRYYRRIARTGQEYFWTVDPTRARARAYARTRAQAMRAGCAERARGRRPQRSCAASGRRAAPRRARRARARVSAAATSSAAQPRARDQRVEVDRIVAQRVEQRAHARRRRAAVRRVATSAATAPAMPQLLEHVLRGLDELRAFADQLVTALRERRMDRAGNREHVAALLAGEARGDERARRQRRLDDEHAAREPADQAIAARKVLLARRRAGRELGQRAPPRAAISCARSRLRAG